LAHLIRLGFAVITLQVEFFFDSWLPEDMMTAAYALLKSKRRSNRRSSSNEMFASDVPRNI